MRKLKESCKTGFHLHKGIRTEPFCIAHICQLPPHLLFHQGWIITIYLSTGKDGAWHRGDQDFLQTGNILHPLTPATCHFFQDKAPSHSSNTVWDRAQYLLWSPPTPERLSISNHQTENCISKITPPPHHTACSLKRCWAPRVFFKDHASWILQQGQVQIFWPIPQITAILLKLLLNLYYCLYCCSR